MQKFVFDAARAALVIIDMQEFSCTVDDESLASKIDGIVTNINSLSRACREAGVPVIWVRHNIRSSEDSDNGGLFHVFHSADRTASVTDGGVGTEIFRKMDVDAGRDHVVFKNRYSAFLADPPQLKQKLDKLNRTQLLMTGIAANVCVECTLRDAMQLDYEVFLVSDGTVGTDELSYGSTISNAERFFGDVLTADEVIKKLDGEGAGCENQKGIDDE